MSDAQTRVRQFTTRAANASQIEQHARAAYVVWAKGKNWEVSSSFLFASGQPSRESSDDLLGNSSRNSGVSSSQS